MVNLAWRNYWMSPIPESLSLFRHCFCTCSMKIWPSWDYLQVNTTARKVSKYGVFSGPYFSVFGLNTRKYGAEKNPYFETFHAVCINKVLFLQRNPRLPSPLEFVIKSAAWRINSILHISSFASLNTTGRGFSLKKLMWGVFLQLRREYLEQGKEIKQN